MTKNMELSLADVLSQMVDECQTLPSEVLDLLLSNFSRRSAKLTPSAHQLTVQISTSSSDRLQSHVAQYFSENIVAASSEEDIEEREKELQASHALIAQINRTVPALLLNVVAILEQELTAEDVLVRQIAIRTLGQMLGEKTSVSLAATYPSAWRAWLGRSRDKVSSMRVLWIESLSGVLANHSELRADVTPVLTEKLQDPDERVRATLVRVIGTLDYETVLHHLDRDFLVKVAERLRDRRLAVRAEAQEALGRLYSLAYPEIENHDPAATKHFAWIPSAMLRSSIVETVDSKPIVPMIAAFEKHILPLPARPEDEGAWVNRLLMVMKNLDEQNLKALFNKLNNMQTPHTRKPYLPFIEACEAYNGGVMTEKEAETLAKLKASLRGSTILMPNGEKATHDLLAFAKTNDTRIFRLLKACIDPNTDFKSYLKARTEALRRVEAADEKLLPTMTAFVQIASYPFVNRHSVPTLLKRLSSGKSQWRDSQIGSQGGPSSTRESVASTVGSQSQGPFLSSLSDMEAFKISAGKTLDFISKSSPEMYYPHVSDLIRSLQEEGETALTEATLRGLCAVKRSGRQLTLDSRALERLALFVRQGTPSQAKYAARLLALSHKDISGAGRHIEELLSELTTRIKTARPSQLVCDLGALGQFIKHAPALAENVWDTILKEVLKDLGKDWSEQILSAYSEDDDWVSDSKMEDSVKAKLLGLDILTERGIASMGPEGDKVAEVTVPVFRLLFRALDSGETRAMNTPLAIKARLRLKAALCVLKLAALPAGDKAIQRDFINLALVVQDPSYQVRNQFLHKILLELNKPLSHRRHLAPRYNAIPFVAAIDPEEENPQMVAAWASRFASLPADVRLKQAEMTVCRYVHLLSHHPDFARDSIDSIKEFVPYLQFFIDCISTEKNVGLLYYLAGRLKTVRDGSSQGASENLYTLSELTQLVIKHKAARHNWRLEAYPGTFKVPSDTGLKPLPSPEAQKEIYSSVWLPQSIVDSIEAEIAKAERRRAVNAGGGGPKEASGERKRKTSSTDAAAKKAARRSANKRKRLSKKASGGGDGGDEDASGGSGSDSDASTSEKSEVSEDEEVPEGGDEEGRGARTRVAAIRRNERRAERRAALAKSRGATAKNTAAGEDEDSELSDVE
jgi:sister-chromatid-cohesion protein PDS5